MIEAQKSSELGTSTPVDLVVDLRQAARLGAKVSELVRLIHQRMGYKENVLIPVLAAFVDAFRLPLIKVLPIREWIGTNNDAEIDALILPEIEKARSEWDSSNGSEQS